MGLLNDEIRGAGSSDNSWNEIDHCNLFFKLNWKTRSQQGSMLRALEEQLLSCSSPHKYIFNVYF